MAMAAGGEPVEWEAFLGEADGGGEGGGEGEGAEAGEGEGETGDGAGDGDRAGADDVGVVLDGGPAVEAGVAFADEFEGIGTGGGGGLGTVLDDDAGTVGEGGGEDTAAAETAHHRFDDTEDETGDHGGVDRVAAVAEDGDGGGGGEGVEAGDHTALGDGLAFAVVGGAVDRGEHHWSSRRCLAVERLRFALDREVGEGAEFGGVGGEDVVGDLLQRGPPDALEGVDVLDHAVEQADAGGAADDEGVHGQDVAAADTRGSRRIPRTRSRTLSAGWRCRCRGRGSSRSRSAASRR